MAHRAEGPRAASRWHLLSRLAPADHIAKALAVAALAVVALAAAGPAGPGPAGAPDPEPAGGRVVIGVRGDVTSFNIYTATSAFSQEVIDLLQPRLVVEQDDFQDGPPTFRPGLAMSWAFSKDRKTLIFNLDPRARWSDGRPVTAADVVLSHKAATSRDVAWVGSDVKEFISAVEAPDPYTVLYRFKRVYPYQLMDAAEGNILPAHVYGSIPFAEWPRRPFDDVPVAGGPFVLKRHERGTLIELARNPAYAGPDPPQVGAILFRILPDEETLMSELITGGIDVLENLPVLSLPRVEKSPRFRVERSPDLSYTFICWNTARPLFRDARVRRALTMAIDRAAIIEALLPGAGRPSHGPILSFLWAFDRGARPPAFDPDAARDLLRETGWRDHDGDGVLDKDGKAFRFDLEINQGSGQRADVAEMAAAHLRKVGADAITRTYETGAFIARHEKHDFDAFVGSWRESTKVDLKSAFHGASRDGGYNYGLYADPELDRLIDRARSENDPGVARDLWGRAQRIIARDQPYTFLFERDRLHVVPRRLTGVRASPRSLYVALAAWSWDDAVRVTKEGR